MFSAPVKHSVLALSCQTGQLLFRCQSSPLYQAPKATATALTSLTSKSSSTCGTSEIAHSAHERNLMMSAETLPLCRCPSSPLDQSPRLS